MFVPSNPNKNNSKIANAKTNAPISLKAHQPLPSHEQISKCAYAIYQSGGCVNGQDQQDWFRAEKEVFALRKQ